MLSLRCLLPILALCHVQHVTSFSANEVMKGDVTTLYTNNVFSFDKYWIELYSRSYFIFSVRACGDVHLALAEVRAPLSVNITEVVLGGWYNTKSVIRNGQGAREHFLEVQTPNLMHCTDFRTFWIEWGGRMRVGQGPIPGEQVFMDLENSRHWVSAIGFSTGYGYTGVWQIPENQGHYMIVNTPDDFRYEYLWKTTDYMDNHFLFRVRACSDVHINLTPIFGTRHYEVVLGGWNNTRSLIRYGSVHRAEHLETGIISCDEFRLFWIEWEGGMIRVGKGENVRRLQILNATDPGYVGINHVSVSSGFGHTASWILSENLENVYRFWGHSWGALFPDYTVFTSTSRQTSLVFEVVGCSAVWVGLSSSVGFSDFSAYHIYIGDQNNTRSGVRHGMFGNPLHDISTPNILHCVEPMWFWVSWRPGFGHFGRGNLVGFAEVLQFNVSDMERINTVGLTSTDPSGAYFLTRKNSGDSVTTYTYQSLDRRQMWMSVRQQLMFTFRLRACHSAHLTLSGFIGVHDELTYEIILGSCYRIVVRDHVDGIPNEITSANSTSDITSCTDYKSFWISWVDGYVRVGHGFRYLRSELLQVQQRKPHPINAINIATSGTRGEWEVENDNGDYLMITSPWDNSVVKWFHLHSWTHWFHFQTSGSAAHIILASRYQDPLDVYNIYIGASENTEVALWKDSTLLTRTHRPNLMHVDHMSDFWISWEGGQIKVGRTKYRDEGVLIDYKDSKPFQITSMGLTGDRGAYAEYRLWENIGVELAFTSSYQVYYDQVWWSVRHRTSTVFALRACSRVELVLSAIMHEYYNPRHTFTILLNDSNQYSSIWRGFTVTKLVEVSTPDVLSCSTERFYWLSWHDGHLALGSGKIKGRNTIVSFQDMEALAITALSFSSIGSDAYWRFPLSQDDFQVVPPKRDPNALSGGEIAGIVIGSILLFILFVFIMMQILAPTYTDGLIIKAKNGLSGFSSSNTSGEVTSGSSTSFENPVAMSADAFSEVHIS